MAKKGIGKMYLEKVRNGLLLLIVFYLLLPVEIFAKTPTSIKVDSGSIGRSGYFRPNMTIVYSDGTSDTFPGDIIFRLVSMSLPYVGWNGRAFYRSGGSPDGEVLCLWEYNPGGMHLTTTSTVMVRGEIRHSTITRGEVGRHNYFQPEATLVYTDETVETWAPPYPYFICALDSFSTPNKIAWNGRAFYRIGSNNGTVRVTWRFTDGKTIFPKSYVYVSGGADGYLTDNNGNSSDKETAPNCTSKNKETTSCPACHAGTCNSGCSGSCGPETNAKNCQSDPKAADPININNLEFVAEEVDMKIPGRGIDFEVKRTYRSRINFPSSLGWNWAQEYNVRFMRHPENSSIVLLYNGYGRGEEYYIETNGNVTPPEYRFKKVVKEADGTLVLRNRNGFMSRFYKLDGTARAGRLQGMISRCGNRLTFAYNADGQISVVYDSLSRPIQYHYNTDGRLDRIVDFTGR